MSSTLSVLKNQFFDSTGNPLVGGKVYTYAAGTTTPLATYTDSSGNTPNTNPIILDSRGEANIWLGTSLYYIELKTSSDVLQWTTDNVGGAATFSALSQLGGSSLVGFVQAGTGAVATTVQSVLRRTINVADYGALTTAADNSAAFQNAIAAAVAAGACEIEIPYGATGTYTFTQPIVGGATLHDGLKFKAIGFLGGSDLTTDGVTLQYTGAGTLFDIRCGNNTTKIYGNWEFEGLTFQTTDDAADVFAINFYNASAAAYTPSDTPATGQPGYAMNVKFKSCKAWGPNSATTTGMFIRACKTFELIMDEACYVRGFLRALYAKGCDNCTIAGRFSLNVRHVQIDKSGTFGNSNKINANFFGPPITGNAVEPAYMIYDNGTYQSTINAPFLEGASSGMLFLNGVDTTIINPFFSTTVASQVCIRLGTTMVNNVLIAPNTTASNSCSIVDDGISNYDVSHGLNLAKLAIFAPSTKFMLLSGVISPRINITASSAPLYPNASHSMGQKLEGEAHGMVERKKIFTAFNTEELMTSAGISTTGFTTVADTSAATGFAIRAWEAATSNLSNFAAFLQVGYGVNNGDTVRANIRYRTVGARGAGTSRWYTGKNSAVVSNGALADSATYTLQTLAYTVTGASVGDNLQIGVYNNSSDIPLNVESITLEVIPTLNTGISPDVGNVAGTLYAHYGLYVGATRYNKTTFIWNTPITEDRAITLSGVVEAGTTAAADSPIYRIVRTANCTGGFNINVGTGPLKALAAAGTWCDVQYRGVDATWILVGYGTL